MKGIIIRSPDDMHFHPRSEILLQNVLPYTSKVFKRGVVMGNLPKPIITADGAEFYRKEILRADPGFDPIMTILLTAQTTPSIVEEAFDRGVKVLKYIPGNASTNSEEGLSLEQFNNNLLFGMSSGAILKMVQKLGMIFSWHLESPFNVHEELLPEPEREKEAIFFLKTVMEFFPKLKIVAEHASTSELIEFVANAPKNVAATLTAHHAILTYGDVCDEIGKIINPYHYCKPIAKKPSDRNAIVRAMLSGNPKFFFGSDSAPHPASAKTKFPPAAGIFSAPVALPILCELFDKNNALPKLENFVSRFGAEFYGLPLNSGELVLKRKEWIVPENLGDVRIFKGGHKLSWIVY
jgi:dihydroorotase